MAGQIRTENELRFDFRAAVADQVLDSMSPSPTGMKLVDFVIEEADRLLFIEVKDPVAPGIPDEKRKEVLARELPKLTTRALVVEELVPKARDSYCYLHLMDQINKPIDYYFLTTADELAGVTSELLINLRDSLEARLRKEGPEPWVKFYIRNCHIVTLATWPSALLNYPVSRAGS